ncbi:MAG: hypothetical protein GY835_19575 [bacterium]|nr:hypothetical protein [bacterium]
MTFLPQAGTPDLPLPVWLIAFDGWLVLADVELKGMLVDADRNRFLLDLLGAEAVRQLDWDAIATETEVNNATHADFRSTIRLRLQ